MMIRFKYRFCKVHMARFVTGDLADPVRQRVARYIDECEDCYHEFTRHREFALNLERSLPTLGQPGTVKLEQIWSSLQDELSETPSRAPWMSEFGSRLGVNFSYGLVIIAITVALLLPMMVGFHANLIMVDLPLLPRYAEIVRTPALYSSQEDIVSATTVSNSRRPTPLLQNTPSPNI